MKSILFLMLLCITQISLAGNFSNLYFSKVNVKLTAQEKAALKISEKWANAKPTGMKPFTGPDGSIKFLFGAQYTSIVCAVLQLCDVELEPGEQINSLKLGDTARWTVDPAVTGYGSSQVLHLIIKPLDVGLNTSLVVTTDRRTYRLRLKSHRTKYIPAVSFAYSENTQAKWEAIKSKKVQQRQNMTIKKTGEYLGDLNFKYDIEGEREITWRPIRVYNDGRKTIIQMPSTMSQTEAPTLLVIRKDGGVFSCCGLIELDTLIRDNNYQLLRCQNGTETNI
ncbi:MAG: P-type conjugative transfer protein TrbG, partial [gamma proteobacterium symbiont of Lucinoma myriamae]|nr:P-type conjugative transfer protein TrbG [gamma proteobacterium symbiont of Lucinoma myriamae]MCU7833372.1 P-type conjugative transfer protein TrbG [gamma proteobacterium symbiont of Lucinoma myriamae]